MARLSQQRSAGTGARAQQELPSPTPAGQEDSLLDLLRPQDEADLQVWRLGEDSIAWARLTVAVVNLLGYLFLTTGPNPIPWLAYGTLAVASLYSAWVIPRKPHQDRPFLSSSLTLTFTDATVIAAWLTATGGFASPYFVLWYIAIVAVSFRYDAWSTLAAALLYTAIYASMTAFTGSFVDAVPLLAIRTSYIFLAGALGTLVSTVTRRETHERQRYQELARELQEAKQQLETKATQLERANEDLEQFASVISHDVREPLRTISGHLGMIESRLEDPDEHLAESLEYAQEAAQRLAAMIDDLHSYTHIQKEKSSMEPFDLVDATEDAVTNLAYKIEDTDAEVEVDEETLPTAYGDQSQIALVLQNLLSNAIKYSGDQTPKIQIRAENGEDRCRVHVADEGIGIPEDQQDAIFEVFHQGDGAQDGEGIGLAMCQRIVARHGGEIRVESEPGEGSTFTFTLPLDSQDAAQSSGLDADGSP